MQTLLNRMDRTSMYSGLEARVPFADHRIIEYLFNVPWDMKARGNIVKALLREAGRGLLPDEILFIQRLMTENTKRCWPDVSVIS